MILIGCGTILVGYLQVAFWSVVAARQTRTIRQTLFRSILEKEIAYFDQHKTGEMSTRLTDDVNKIHDGIGDKLGSATQFISSFITGFALGSFIPWKMFENRRFPLGFIKGWKLALVILSISPLLFVSAMLLSKVSFSREDSIRLTSAIAKP